MSNLSKTKTKSNPKQKTKPTHICEYCDKIFHKPSHLEIHRRVHTGERPFPCNLCEYSATRRDHLRLHIRYHLKEKQYKCPESESGCNYASSEKSCVTTHHKIVHLREKPNTCPVLNCAKKFGTKNSLTNHMKTHEENSEKPFQCSECPFKTKRMGCIKRHMSFIHSEERHFKCPHSNEGCSRAFKTKADLNSHLETHREKTLTCPHANSGSGSGCEYKTNSTRRLRNHLKTHNSDSEKKYKCRICEYSAHVFVNLSIHMRTHTKETPFKCKVRGCDFQGKCSSNLIHHTRAVHEKLRPFKCEFSGCSYAAAMKGDLKRHQTAVHESVGTLKL